MTVFLYSGTPGSGKSCHQAEDVYYNLHAGYDIVCNYYVNLKKCGHYKGTFTHVENDELTPEWLMKHSEEYFSKHKFKEGRIILFIDEAQLLFNSRDWGKQGRAGWLSFFTQHRKFGYNIILVAQFDRMLDRQIRSIIEYNVIHRKFSSGNWKVKLLGLLFGGNCYMAVEVWYPMKMVLKGDIHRIRKRWYSLYDSYKHFSDDSTVPPTIAFKSPETGDIAGKACVTSSAFGSSAVPLVHMGGTTTPPIDGLRADFREGN